jgi:4-hydroxy-4-methyl-2-oxoglutarate aldolase
MSPPDANVQRAARLDTATLSDALDRLGLVGQCAGLSPRDPGFRLAGRAFTVLYGPAGSPAGTVGDFLDDVTEGMVVAIDNGGREDATVWGDILTELAHLKKISGTVIDGINRDTALCLKLNYPVFSRACWMRTGKDRVQVEAVGAPVNIGNARVCPGDLMKGDADGVIVIPRAHEDKVLAAAEEIHEAEERIRAAVRSGVSLTEARAQNRYHSLQTREGA